MGGVCCDPAGQWCIWRSISPQTTQYRLISFTNLQGYISINDLDLCSHLAQTMLFYPHLAPLAHILTRVNSTMVLGWIKRGSICHVVAVAGNVSGGGAHLEATGEHGDLVEEGSDS